MKANSEQSWIRFSCLAPVLLIPSLFLTACALGGGGGFADNGGISGTGISQGAIRSFGSVFVNGVRWDLSSASIGIDGEIASEADLRVGMVVRIEGDFEAGNLSGTAIEIDFDNLVEGPVEGAPVETIPGVEKTFSILGQTVKVNASTTAFDDGASFESLAEDDVLEVSGFEDETGGVIATRVALRGVFPSDDEVERVGVVANLMATSSSEGIFDLGTLTVRYTAGTDFSDVTPATLMNGDQIEVEGMLRVSGTEIDATEIELIQDDLDGRDLERIEVEGVAVACPESTEFCVGGIAIDTSVASFDPIGFVPMIGDEIEAEGPLVNGVLVASEIESEDDDEDENNVTIEAAVTSIDAEARTLDILGITVVADGDTVLEDASAVDDENFMFDEILPGNFLIIEGVFTEGTSVRAISIERADAVAGDDDIVIEGPVTDLDTLTPSLEVLGQSIPLDAGTLYFDGSGTARSEEEFFRTPGDVTLGDIVEVIDEFAANLSSLTEADEVELRD
jgi:hypothetical protein